MKHEVICPGSSRLVDHMDRFAEALSELDDIELASKAIGVTADFGRMIFNRIQRQLGPQAI